MWFRQMRNRWARLKHERKVPAMVDAFGLNITNVGFPDGYESHGFSHTAGLPQSVGQPDVVVFGLPLEQRANLLLGTFELCREGLVLADFVEVYGLIDGQRCILREVLPANLAFKWFSSAMMYQHDRTGRPMERAMQLVWPCAETGLFPWEDGCTEWVRAMQVPLYDEVVPL